MGSEKEKRWVILSLHPMTKKWELWSNDTFKYQDSAIDEYESYNHDYHDNQQKGLVEIVPCTVTTEWQEPGGGKC